MIGIVIAVSDCGCRLRAVPRARAAGDRRTDRRHPRAAGRNPDRWLRPRQAISDRLTLTPYTPARGQDGPRGRSVGAGARGLRSRAGRALLHRGARPSFCRALDAPRGGLGARRRDAHRAVEAAGRPRGKPRRQPRSLRDAGAGRGLRGDRRRPARARQEVPVHEFGPLGAGAAPSRSAYVTDPDGHLVEFWTARMSDYDSA